MNRFAGLLLTVSFSAALTFGQAITFTSPVPWVTQRNDSIIARAQIDTAQIKQRTMAITLAQVSNGKQKVLSSKKFKIDDYTAEFSFGIIKRELLGGNEYLKLEWSVPGTEYKGTIAPIGIVDLEKIPKADAVEAVHSEKNTGTEVIAGLKDQQFKTIGSFQFATAWNKEALFIVIKKGDDSGTLQFAIDGKTGKNAFLSYPDRIIACNPSKDSLWGVHYTRSLKGDTLTYSQNNWNAQLTRETDGDVVIRVQWHDMGIIPFEDRIIGFGAFALNADGNKSNAVPEQAQLYIPGTWGDLILKK